ncbi:hypothetical protein [Actinoplanes cyaneus]|uniref:hypothetical protein n=1 Tax=Actinoplanes cyaneus TaxID=52696 RepID=UPI001944DCEA|nr:hypothetical protein [Actinoplanes cyaneus]MCW2141675.1 hypothetical protein [Actinoplanes cyaneus]
MLLKKLDAPVLDGRLVRLEPLERRHAADLAIAAEENRDSYRFTWVPRSEEVDDYLDAQLARVEAGVLARGRRARRGSCGTPRSTRSSPRNGRAAAPT